MFTFNTRKGFFIWFSKNKEVFLNIENQLRLIRIREKNPSLQITMLYSAELLSENAKKNMSAFLSKLKVHAEAFETICEKNAERYTSDEKELIEIAKIELKKSINNEGGNLAAFSDILRTLCPIIEDYGFYFQLSNSLDLEAQSKYIQIKTPIVFWACNDNDNRIAVNNNFIAAAINEKTEKLHPEARNMLKVIHQGILSQYRSPLNSKLFETNEQMSANTLIFNGIIQHMTQKNKRETIYNLRKKLEMFSPKAFFELSRFLKQEEILIRIINSQWNNKLKDRVQSQQLINFFENSIKTLGDLETLSPSFMSQLHGIFLLSHFQKLNKFKEIEKDENIENFLEEISNQEIGKLQFDFYKRTVEHISGPTIFYNVFKQHEIKGVKIIDFGLLNNNLTKSILILTNTLAIEKKEEKDAEASWTKQGMDKVKSREALMTAAARTIETAYLNYRKKRKVSSTIEFLNAVSNRDKNFTTK